MESVALLFLVAMALIVVVNVVRLRLQTAEKAATWLRRSLGATDTGKLVVSVRACRPLSEDMMKAVAWDEGFEYSGVRENSVRRLKFTRRPSMDSRLQ